MLNESRAAREKSFTHAPEPPPSPAAEMADIEQLYRREWPTLLALATALTRDPHAAEDLVHDAFLGLQRRWDTLDDQSAAAGYLRASVLNRARSSHRRLKIARRHAESSDEPTAPGADLHLLLGEEHRAVLRTLQKLPRRQRQVLALRYWAEMKDREIASALGVSIGTVKSTASRALAAAGKHLEEL